MINIEKFSDSKQKNYYLTSENDMRLIYWTDWVDLDILRDNEVVQVLNFHDNLKNVMRRIMDSQIVIIISNSLSQKYHQTN